MGLTPRISLTQNMSFQQLAEVTSVSGPVHGSMGFGSSLFLQRLFLPGVMVLSEIDLVLGMSFPGTNSGGGAMSRSFIIYTFSNSTLLGSLFSVSSSSSWASGTTTAGSVTRIQAGWAGSVLAAMTLSSAATLGPGEYVIGNMIDFTQATTPWTVSLFGAAGAGITSSSAALLSAAGLASESALANSGTPAATITLFATTPTAANVLSSGNLAVVSAFTGTTPISVFSNSGVASKDIAFGATTVNPITNINQLSSVGIGLLWTTPPVGATALATAGLASGYFISTTAASVSSTAAVISSAGLGSYGLATGSHFTSTVSTSAVTQVGLSSLLPTFTYIGSATSTQTSAFPSAFIAGVLATNALPGSSFVLTTNGTSLTLWTSGGCIQPWFCLVGA